MIPDGRVGTGAALIGHSLTVITMSQAADSSRNASVFGRAHSSFVAAAALAPLLFFSACRDMPTAPVTGPLAPTSADLTLTGGVGTQIFASVTPGEPQATGDARGLNALGQVTGGAFDLGGFSQDADPYRWTPGGDAVKITGCCDSQAGNDINDAGTVVGITQTSAIFGSRGFVATGTTLTALPLLPGGNPEFNSVAVAINNAGQIVGTSPFGGASPAQHATLWSPTLVPQDLGTLGGTRSRAIDINASAQVIGSSQLPGDATSSFFFWSAETGMQNLAAVNGAITDVVEINDAGQIIGTYVAPSGQSHAFLYTPGSGLRDLGTLGGTTSAPTGLNNRGDVVGNSTLPDNTTHAFLWTAAEGMEDITALSGVTDVRRLNDNLQTLSGASTTETGLSVARKRPRLVQLQVTQNNARPTALFTVECNGLTCVLDARGSLDDKPGLTYAWDLNKFPDGSATGDVVTVTYAHESQRTVTLTVTDAHGLTSSSSKTFTVRDFPIAAFTYTCTGLTCTFDSGGSTSTGAPISSRIWTFGDEQSLVGANAVTPSHTYAQAGTYSVTLEVWAANISERAVLTQQVTVAAPAQNQAPIASFTFTCQSLTCSLDATSSSDDKGIVEYDWDLNAFPEGSATGPIVTKTYPHAGTRFVTLTVTDAEGLSSSITKALEPDATVATDAAPVARFTFSCTGTVCTLDASTSSDDVGIVSYDWVLGKFPDNTASGATVTTDYFHTSTRTVTLTVTDTKGQTSSTTKTFAIP